MVTGVRLVAAAIFAALILGFTPASTASEAPTRVLIVGDSVTQGRAGDFTWRYFMWKALEADGEPVDFVGRRTGTFRLEDDGRWNWDYNEPDAYADPDFDQDHGARWGGRISAENNWDHDPIGQQVTAHQPDVVVSLWGINDLGRSDVSPEDLVATYRAWIAEVRAAKPDTDMVIGRLPQTWRIDGEVVAFNDIIDDLAAELTTPESQVTVATMGEEFTQDDTSDNLHPNTVGQQKIARMMGSALTPLLPAPAPVMAPEVPEATTPAPVAPVVPAPAPVATAPTPIAAVAPSTPRRVRAVRDGAKVVVRWKRAPTAPGYVVHCGTRSKVTSSNSVALRAKADRCKVRAVNTAGASAWVAVRVRR